MRYALEDQLIKTFSEACIDADTGEIKQSMYGEFISKVKGLEVVTERVNTQLTNWTIQPKNQDVKALPASDSAPAWQVQKTIITTGAKT